MSQDNTPFKPASSASRIFFWLALLIISIAAIFYNFTLLDGLMAKLVGGQTRVFGNFSIARVWACLILILEVCIGLFFTETKGVTTMIPAIRALPADTRRRFGNGLMIYLVTFAGIQAVLVWMATTLHAGIPDVLQHAPMVLMPDAGQMAIAFALPFVLILAGMSLDRVVRTLRGQAG